MDVYGLHYPTGVFKENSHAMKHHTTDVMSPRPPIQCCFLNFVLGGLQKTASSVDDGTSDHNIEVGGCGGKQGIYVVSRGWLFFF